MPGSASGLSTDTKAVPAEPTWKLPRATGAPSLPMTQAS